MSDKSIALVTGAAQGIGYACAQALAETDARLVLADINASGVEAAAEKLGGDTVGIACDMGNPGEIGDVVAFLASSKASYITGETIYVDGGRIGMNYTC